MIKNIYNNYDLEIEKLKNYINNKKYKKILLQFPDGFKQCSKEIIDTLEKNTNADFFIHFGSCFGACDIPSYIENLNFELFVQWGHSKFKKNIKSW